MKHSTQQEQGPKEETLNFLRKFAREYYPEDRETFYTFGLFNNKNLALC